MLQGGLNAYYVVVLFARLWVALVSSNYIPPDKSPFFFSFIR